MAGLREEVDSLIDRAVSELPGPAVADLADELRAVGREEAAFRTYAAVAEAVATRPPDIVAQLCQAMTEAGRAEDSASVAHAVIERASDRDSLLDVATAFWHTNQHEHANRTLERAAEVLSNTDVTGLAAELRARDQEEAAYQLCLHAAKARPASAIREIVDTLRDEGRPVDARKLLEETVRQAPVGTVLELLDGCTEGDQRCFLHTLADHKPNKVAQLLDTLISGDRIDEQLHADPITIDGLRTKLLPIIFERLDPQIKEGRLANVANTGDGPAMAALLPTLPADDAKLLMFLVVQAGNPTLTKIIHNLSGDSSEAPVLQYLVDQPTPRLAVLVEGLQGAQLDEYAEAVLDQAAEPGRDVNDIARDVAFLFGKGKRSIGKVLLNKVLRGQSDTNFRKMINAIRRQKQPSALAAAAEWVRETHTHLLPSHVDSVLYEFGLGEYRTRGRWIRPRPQQG